MSKEFTSYKSLLDSIENPILKKRAELSLEYYIDKAVFYKRLWNVLSVIGIVLPAAATFASCTGVASWGIALITAATTVATGLLALFKCADKKNSYRNSAENLKSALCAYASKTGHYAQDSAKNDDFLFQQLERIIKEGYNKIAVLESQQVDVKG